MHVNVLDDLIANKKLINVAEQIADKYDYDSLLIKTTIFGLNDKKDIIEANKLTQNIRNLQSENGSWEETVVATVYHIEKLMNLGVSCDDFSVQKGVAFLFKNLNLNWNGLQSSGKAYGLQVNGVFSTKNRDLEFAAAKNYKEETVPRLICYRHLGIIQNSLCLKSLVQLGLETDERVESALYSIYSIYRDYSSLCYFRIQKKFLAKKRALNKVKS